MLLFYKKKLNLSDKNKFDLSESDKPKLANLLKSFKNFFDPNTTDLYKAITENSLLLLEIKNEQGDTILHVACRQNAAYANCRLYLMSLLDQCPDQEKLKELINTENKEKKSILYIACKYDQDISLINWLIAKGANPLQVAADNCHPCDGLRYNKRFNDLAHIFDTAKININTKFSDGKSFFLIALSELNNFGLIKKYIAEDANIDPRSEDGKKALTYIARKYPQFLQSLLKINSLKINDKQYQYALTVFPVNEKVETNNESISASALVKDFGDGLNVLPLVISKVNIINSFEDEDKNDKKSLRELLNERGLYRKGDKDKLSFQRKLLNNRYEYTFSGDKAIGEQLIIVLDKSCAGKMFNGTNIIYSVMDLLNQISGFKKTKKENDPLVLKAQQLSQWLNSEIETVLNFIKEQCQPNSNFFPSEKNKISFLLNVNNDSQDDTNKVQYPNCSWVSSSQQITKSSNNTNSNYYGNNKNILLNNNKKRELKSNDNYDKNEKSIRQKTHENHENEETNNEVNANTL